MICKNILEYSLYNIFGNANLTKFNFEEQLLELRQDDFFSWILNDAQMNFNVLINYSWAQQSLYKQMSQISQYYWSQINDYVQPECLNVLVNIYELHVMDLSHSQHEFILFLMLWTALIPHERKTRESNRNQTFAFWGVWQEHVRVGGCSRSRAGGISVREELGEFGWWAEDLSLWIVTHPEE